DSETGLGARSNGRRIGASIRECLCTWIQTGRGAEQTSDCRGTSLAIATTRGTHTRAHTHLVVVRAGVGRGVAARDAGQRAGTLLLVFVRVGRARGGTYHLLPAGIV